MSTPPAAPLRIALVGDHDPHITAHRAIPWPCAWPARHSAWRSHSTGWPATACPPSRRWSAMTGLRAGQPLSRRRRGAAPDRPCPGPAPAVPRYLRRLPAHDPRVRPQRPRLAGGHPGASAQRPGGDRRPALRSARSPRGSPPAARLAPGPGVCRRLDRGGLPLPLRNRPALRRGTYRRRTAGQRLERRRSDPRGGAGTASVLRRHPVPTRAGSLAGVLPPLPKAFVEACRTQRRDRPGAARHLITQ